MSCVRSAHLTFASRECEPIKIKSASEVLRVMYSGVSGVLHVSACELSFD